LEEAEITSVAREYMGEPAPITGIFAGVVTLAYISCFIAAVTSAIPLWLAFVIASYLIFMAYTPLHESVHQNICGRNKQYRWANDMIGYAMASIMGFSFSVHKWAHRQHHLKTNIHDEDPDHVFNGNKVHDALLAGVLLVANEYRMFFVHAFPRLDRTRQLLAIAEIFLFLGWRITLAFWFPWEVLWLCVIANIAGVTWLVIIFAWVVHLPLNETARYRDTNVFLSPKPVNRVVTWFWLWQNYHGIHHLFPRIPFYQYDDVFNRIQTGMKERSAPIIHLGPAY